jgi:enoyl-CoA hydratase/carnithine racemase
MIEYQKDGRIAMITINRPEALGVLTVRGHEELYEALLNFRNDEELLVGIITGTGKAFCAGSDIKDTLPALKRAADRRTWWEAPPSPAMRGLELWKPLIAAINGLTLGGGMGVILTCDIRIASENARFGYPEINVGLPPVEGSTQRLPRIVGLGIAEELILTGRIIDAQEAYRIGLVTKVIPPDELMPAARAIAETICQAAPLAVKAAKEQMIRGVGMSLEEGLSFEFSFLRPILATKDFEEGIAAFLEKRKPKFEGR